MTGPERELIDAANTAAPGAQPGEGDRRRDAHQMSSARRPVRDRDVVLAAVVVVAAVLALELVTGLVPALDDILGFAPVVIVALVLVTVIVLGRALWAARRGG